jgi:hypothetical protein
MSSPVRRDPASPAVEESDVAVDISFEDDYLITQALEHDGPLTHPNFPEPAPPSRSILSRVSDKRFLLGVLLVVVIVVLKSAT